MLAAQFLCLPFADLTTTQLYALLRLRSEVFVVEQVCPFQDMDNCDQQALHVLGYRGEELLCYARLLPRGSKYAAVSIGRVVSAASVRRDGFGRALMSHCIAQCQQRWPDQDIIISAQQYLEEFYRSFGFTKVKGPYMEDNIPHLEMHLASSDNPQSDAHETALTDKITDA